MAKSILDLRPENAVKQLGSRSEICLLSSKDIFDVLKKEPVPVIVMANNARIPHVIPGILPVTNYSSLTKFCSLYFIPG